MSKEFASLAKITRPNVSGISPRTRLFRMLDTGKKPVVWVTGPPGAGKTTLAASYLSFRKLSCIWYQVDAADVDLASFFYYLGLAAQKAAPRFRKPLPLFTPEYLPGIQTFTRRFFEDLYRRLKHPFVLVFDNYQLAPSGTDLHALLAEGLSLLPEGVRCIVVSRAEPPPAFARMRMNGQIGLIGWDDIRFTPAEIKALFTANRRAPVSGKMVKHAHDATEGWAAGLVFLQEKLEAAEAEPELPGRIKHEELFDYFAEEVFRHADDEIRDFLLRTSLLAKIPLPVAQKLTNAPDADKILSSLSKNHRFTTRHAAGEAVYQYHPLFREFLLSRAAAAWSPDSLRELRKQAARLLEESGQTEEAAELYRDAGDWESFAGLITGQAQQLIREGRYRTLEAWITSVPGELLDRSPWLLFWRGACRTPFDPKEGLRHFEKAFDFFRLIDDTPGALLAWSGAVNAVLLGWDDFAPLDTLIAWFYERNDRLVFPSPEVEVECASSMAGALVWRRPDHPDMEDWVKRALSATRKSENLSLKLQVCINASFYYLWVGDIPNALMIDQEIRQMTREPNVSPVALITCKWLEADTSYLTTASYEPGLRAISEALETARAYDIHIWDHMIYALGAYGLLLKGDLGAASEFLEKMKSVLRPDRSHSYCHYHYMAAWHNTLLGDLAGALSQAELALKLALEIRGPGLYFPEILCRLAVANILCEIKKYPEAKEQLAITDDIVRRSRSRIFDFMHRFANARIALEQGDDVRGMDMLRSALELGRSHNFINMLYWWQPSVMSDLFGRALEAGIETGYVERIIRTRRLKPGEGSFPGAAWPWPLKLHTLGRFEIVKDGKPVRFSGKAQKKPLLMLKALVASGPDGASKEQLIDLLWSDSEGDAANIAFYTTLSRLRKMMGDEGGIRLNEGRVSLDPLSCWVDAWAFEKLCKDVAEKRWKGEKISLADKAVDLYKGHFLPADSDYSPTTLIRERLRKKHLGLISGLGRLLEEGEEFEAALDYYEKGLEAEPLAEELYQGLMACYLRLGRKAEAAATYERCKNVLGAELSVAPSPQTELLKQKITEEHQPA